jgi:putative MATE family efflux protein
VIKIALPIAAQNLLMSSLNMVGVMMIGQLGEASVAAVGLAGQVFFLLNLVLFGVVSGAAIFTAQLWGKGDVPNIRRVLGLAVKIGLAAALVFWVLALFFPDIVLGLYTEDAAVIELGAGYLRIFGWAYPFFAVTFAYASVLRSTGNVRAPLVVTILSLALNVALAWLLIFGNLGLPALGVTGAAVASLVARLAECFLILAVVYLSREPSPAAASLGELLAFDPVFCHSNEACASGDCKRIALVIGHHHL